MSTKIARWGNSSGVRIPSRVLAESGFKLGDAVDFVVKASGNIEPPPRAGRIADLQPPARSHRPSFTGSFQKRARLPLRTAGRMMTW